MRSHINLYSYLSYIFIPEAEIYKHWIKWSAYFQEVRNHQSTVASVKYINIIIKYLCHYLIRCYWTTAPAVVAQISSKNYILSIWASTCFKLLKYRLVHILNAFENILKLNKTRQRQTYTKGAEPNFNMHSNLPKRITTDVRFTIKTESCNL